MMLQPLALVPLQLALLARSKCYSVRATRYGLAMHIPGVKWDNELYPRLDQPRDISHLFRANWHFHTHPSRYYNPFNFDGWYWEIRFHYDMLLNLHHYYQNPIPISYDTIAE